MPIGLRYPAIAAAAVLAAAVAGCGSDDDPETAAAPPSATTTQAPQHPAADETVTARTPVGVKGADNGQAPWGPANVGDAVAGADLVVDAEVTSVDENVRIDGIPNEKGELPEPLDGVDINLADATVLSRAGWAHKGDDSYDRMTVRVMRPAKDDLLGIKPGTRYVFFLVERVEPAVDGGPPKVPVRLYNTAWSGGFVPVSASGKLRRFSSDRSRGTEIQAEEATADDLRKTVTTVAAERKLATAAATDSPNLYVHMRVNVRKLLGYSDPADTSDSKASR